MFKAHVETVSLDYTSTSSALSQNFYDAYSHAYASAVLADKLGNALTDSIGDFRELVQNIKEGQSSAQAWKDTWNNHRGLQYRDWLEDGGYAVNDHNLRLLAEDDISKNNGLIQADPDDSQFHDDRPSDKARYDSRQITGDYPPSYSGSSGNIPNQLEPANGDNPVPGLLDGLLPIIPLTGALLALPSALLSLSNLFDNPVESPLILDLDNSGDIELVSLAESNTFFDLNSDGFAEHTGWVAGGDGFLAIDRNSDGVINDNTELFGNTTTDGFDVLAELDATVNGGNADGVIDASDSQFANLRIWQDLNANAVTDAGELKTLAQWGITAINLGYTSVSNQAIEGHPVSSVSSFTMNGQSHTIKDIWFENNKAYSFYVPPANFAYDDDKSVFSGCNFMKEQLNRM